MFSSQSGMHNDGNSTNARTTPWRRRSVFLIITVVWGTSKVTTAQRSVNWRVAFIHGVVRRSKPTSVCLIVNVVLVRKSANQLIILLESTAV